MSDSVIGVAQAFLRAINRQDPAALGELMSPAHRFTDSLGNVVEGLEKMRAGWAAYFLMVPDYSLAIDEFYVDGPAIVMLGWAQGTYSKDGILKDENRWRTLAAIRAIVEDGLITEWQVFADNEPIREKNAAIVSKRRRQCEGERPRKACAARLPDDCQRRTVS